MENNQEILVRWRWVKKTPAGWLELCREILAPREEKAPAAGTAAGAGGKDGEKREQELSREDQ